MHNNASSSLALFDFDGTITCEDSLPLFLVFAVGKSRFLSGLILLSPILLFYKLGIVPNGFAKQLLFRYFLKGKSRQHILEISQRFVSEKLPEIIMASALDKIRWHKSMNHRVIVVSASLEEYLQFFCKREGIELLATRLEYRQKKFTGYFDGKNCYGDEKVHRVKGHLRLDAYQEIYGYGDSRGDRALLSIATHKHYKHFTK